ncbi:hypothetical protein [Gordonia sp. SL306]|uniref:hypothetical protein n=1 Tax=Gordonia sp. SL306 TaxID=2995145 RepID=UPI0022706D68|nr:hypothetical protein [Gordonia sp. SL306]WAC54204.1 hypothetical protein OVA31_16100 [Gordonia sp. SL306]
MTATHAHVAPDHEASTVPRMPVGLPHEIAADHVDTEVRARFLTPDDADWTNDGAATWTSGHVSGLTYSHTSGSDQLVLHNRGAHDLGVLSTPELPGTDGTVFTHLPGGTSVDLPVAESHILQTARVGDRPVLVGQIVAGRDPESAEPLFMLDGPAPDEVDWAVLDPDDVYWKPGDVDFGAPTAPQFVFADPFAHGVHHTRIDGEVALHNHGDSEVAVLTVGADGPLDLVVARPGESVPIPPGDAVCYVQAPRTDCSPTLLGVMWLRSGELMPSVLPIPSRRDHLDYHYLTPWSADWDCGYPQQIHLDAEASGVTYQYRTGADRMTIRNTGDEPIAVIYNRAGERVVAEVAAGTRMTFPVCADADTGQVFSVVGERVDSRPGRSASFASSGAVIPGTSGTPGTATNFGSVVIMLGTVVYSAVPKKNLYLAWSDRRRWLRRAAG